MYIKRKTELWSIIVMFMLRLLGLGLGLDRVRVRCIVRLLLGYVRLSYVRVGLG